MTTRRLSRGLRVRDEPFHEFGEGAAAAGEIRAGHVGGLHAAGSGIPVGVEPRVGSLYHLLERSGKACHLVVPVFVAEAQRVALCEGCQGLRQVGGGRHRRRADQYGDDQHVGPPAESGRDLQAHVVFGVVQPALARVVFDRQPRGPDHGQQGLTRAHFLLDHAGEPLARVDSVDVPEHLIRAEMVAQRVPEAARVRPTVLPPIADEDSAHIGPPPASRLQINGDDMPDIYQ